VGTNHLTHPTRLLFTLIVNTHHGRSALQAQLHEIRLLLDGDDPQVYTT
jgi:hypothetical protein